MLIKMALVCHTYPERTTDEDREESTLLSAFILLSGLGWIINRHRVQRDEELSLQLQRQLFLLVFDSAERKPLPLHVSSSRAS